MDTARLQVAPQPCVLLVRTTGCDPEINAKQALQTTMGPLFVRLLDPIPVYTCFMAFAQSQWRSVSYCHLVNHC